jgi:hypothetical protein
VNDHDVAMEISHHYLRISRRIPTPPSAPTLAAARIATETIAKETGGRYPGATARIVSVVASVALPA